MRVGLINYGGGNLQSVANALKVLGVSPLLIQKAEDFSEVTHLILPGQGEFGDVMTQLSARGLTNPLREWILAGKPYFGICVGFQILFEGSDEAPEIEGLGIVPGRCVKFIEQPGKKIPQMGWNIAKVENPSRFWKALGTEPYFYFVHSYYPKVSDSSWAATTTNYDGEEFVSAVEKGKVLACQFHPEKSQDAGIALIENFLGC